MENLGNYVESRLSLPTLLFVALVFSLNIFAIFTVFTVSSSRTPLPLQIGAQQHPHPQQRELSWNGGESREAVKSSGESQSANSKGGGERVVAATEDTESHLIRYPNFPQGDPSARGLGYVDISPILG